MAVTVLVKKFQVPKSKSEKLVKVEFRGVSHLTKIVEEDGLETINVNKTFEWPVGRAVEEDELLIIELYTRNRLFSDKLIGLYKLVLQKLVIDRKISVSDSLLDENNQPLSATVEFEVSYTPPEELMSTYDVLQDDQQMLIDIEQNIANIEQSMIVNAREPIPLQSKSISVDRKILDRKKATLRAVRNLVRFGKQRLPKDSDNEDEIANFIDEIKGNSQESEADQNYLAGLGSPISMSCNEGETSTDALIERQKKSSRMKADFKSTVAAMLKSQNFQVCLTIIEARQLAGINMDPIVCIQVGDQKKYTSVKESTNCPYYNEYFVFDFHMPPIMLFDKIITLSVLQSRNFLRGKKFLGSFKFDVGTVWAEPDHQFYHKWAVLTDPDDIAGGPKGYLKCDISVIGKGDSVKVPPKSDKDEDDIEANLLLPDGVPTDRQKARFIVKIYRADGLPKMNSSIMANVKKAFTGELNDLVDPYVQVSFAGLMGKTSVVKHSYAPVWNEQLIFTEMFPPLCQRIKIQLRADDPVKPTVIGTHFIDLKTISNDGEKGFLPTFGPSFIHMYGSTRDYSLIDEHSSLNTGLGEGVSYRARLLVSIRTEITDSIDLSPVAIELEPIIPINEAFYAKNEEFFLFATILDASILEKKLGDKAVHFEISVGNAGNSMDGHNQSTREHYDSDNEELEVVTTESASWQSTTTPTKPMTHDKAFYFLPYWDNKPCMHIRSVWPDHRRRMYNSNIITKLVEHFEDGLSEVNSAVEAEDPDMEIQLKRVLDDLSTRCAKYIILSKASLSEAETGKTKLDKEHLKLCQREIEQIGNSARNLKALVTKNSFKERLKSAQKCLGRLKILVEDPQHALPDVFLWIISRGKRQAYQRIPARDIIYSPVEEECGKDCGKVQTMFLKLPGKKAMGPSGWSIPAKLEIFLWLGLLKHKKDLFNGLPGGYEHTQEIKNIERPRALPPNTIHYIEKHLFQLRAHIYQARSLIGSDASGLSDPFARIIAGEFSKTTQVIDETLSPTWDELLIFEEILIYGDGDEIKNDPPPIIIEIFDQDKVGKSEFIGRTLAKPNVKLKEDAYCKPKFPPSLEWFTLTRGTDGRAGELLAAFELLEKPNDTEGSLPSLPNPKDIPIHHETDTKRLGTVLPVPRGIRPTLARYRIEVLFWGLRDLKRVHFLTVDKPRIDIECSGNILYSTIIQNRKKNPNFSTLVRFLDLDLPEQELYRPPVTIRAVDCRSFGRYTLVGTHIINSIHKYIYKPMTKKDREAEERKKSLNQLRPSVNNIQSNLVSPTNIENLASDKEKSPLLPKDTSGHTDYGTQEGTKKMKTEINKKRKQSIDEELDDEEDTKDWWTKYFLSKERALIELNEIKNILNQSGNLPVRTDNKDSQFGNASIRTSGQEENKKRFTFKSVATASRFAARISPKHTGKSPSRKTAQCKVYDTELESRPEFDEFKEWLHTFPLYRGKKTVDDAEDDSRIVGYFKGAIQVYKWPLPKDIDDKTIMGFDPHLGLFQGLPSNEPIKVLVRIYIVKAIDLHPMDLNGKADPYIVLQLGSKKISDKDNYVSKQLNPVFGKCFEIEATFPQDSVLTVQIYDWDLVSSDDMIGETKIDLENRFYSRHRASCGLAEVYEEDGYNAWRDALKPTQILAKLCKDAKVESPVYADGMVKIGKQIFFVNTSTNEIVRTKETEEHMALEVLHRWHEFPKIGCHLVPEHVETRPIYNPQKPGIEQGKIEMWVDMFPMDMPLPASKLDISPRKPKSYELRVIIWNTDDVVLEDDAFFTGEKMSDIYVKGWLKGQDDCQCTDIHYRSLTGEGNFNWRFIYPFDYLVAEQKIVITKKESLFSWDETESKIPARLELQVFDADHFSADDFLGAITLDLNKFPRGAKSSKLCSLDMLKTDGSVPMINIFKQKRVKGWWPFFVKKDNEEMELTGKVEAEIHLLTSEEAEKAPAGLARNEPDALDKPNRPDSSFIWFMNPLKSLRYILWHNYKYTILKLFIIAALTAILLLFFYSIPGYTVKKIIGA
ncbi:otoferlin-like isoform X1 [Diorhabda carinulata]|uniref:otoferlin-like isoform X1 n=1 Tax=Diorhabda carinulata TaxID=1163345 RepID=UPI0025A22B58|nr:otoferlin-like isoform X1 [Diorhabda carinulata]XP_057656511.1 otoferlin-like isoform X1 [Diorhabda carinulata]